MVINSVQGLDNRKVSTSMHLADASITHSYLYAALNICGETMWRDEAQRVYAKLIRNLDNMELFKARFDQSNIAFPSFSLLCFPSSRYLLVLL